MKMLVTMVLVLPWTVIFGGMLLLARKLGRRSKNPAIFLPASEGIYRGMRGREIDSAWLIRALLQSKQPSSG